VYYLHFIENLCDLLVILDNGSRVPGLTPAQGAGHPSEPVGGIKPFGLISGFSGLEG